MNISTLPLTHHSSITIYHTIEKKPERAHSILGSTSSTSPTYNSPSLKELDALVSEIIKPEIFDSHQQRFNTLLKSDDEIMKESTSKRSTLQPFKKIRQSSPARKIPSTIDGLLHHKRSTTEKRIQLSRERQLERVMWESASMLSNSHPTPNFVVDRSERTRREDQYSGDQVPLKSDVEGQESLCHHLHGGNQSSSSSPPPPLFEGNIANATPGDIPNGGTGHGTAQHLACLLDSPLALVILIVMGVDVNSRHTAFRRLAMHEAACADSPKCLSLLMGAATRFASERMQEDVSLFGMEASANNFAAASATGFVPMEQDNMPPSNSMTSSPRSGSKIKLPFFSGWGDKSPGHKSNKDDNDLCVDSRTFPEALRIIWNVISLVKSGDMSEEDAAQHILDQVGVSTRTKISLASQIETRSENAEVRRNSALFLYGLAMPPKPQAPNNIDGHGNTPLHWASFKNSVRAIDILLSHNVNVNFPAQPSGWTPLHDAAYSDSAGAVKRLIAAGASVNTRSHSGATPLCFAAQEDAYNATQLLLEAGADPAIRCLGQNLNMHQVRVNNADNNILHSRFSGYTPLHYCAHYNSSKSARVLLNHRGSNQLSGVELLEIPDLNEKLPIHVAVARGSSEVLRELLHGGARVETASYHPPVSPRVRKAVTQVISPTTDTASITIPMSLSVGRDSAPSQVVTPVSSPVLRSLLPSQPINSSKPWNCLSQQSIDACRSLIEEVEQNWTPARHALFSPTDRIAVKEVLRVGKRLEQNGSVIVEIWPYVLSFCGRGWFEMEEEAELDTPMPSAEYTPSNEEEMHCNEEEMHRSSDEDSDGGAEFTQFELDEAHDNVNMAVL